MVVHGFVEKYFEDFVWYETGYQLEAEEGDLVLGARENFGEIRDA